jgi:hypothetical protein
MKYTAVARSCQLHTHALAYALNAAMAKPKAMVKDFYPKLKNMDYIMSRPISAFQEIQRAARR